LFLFPKTTHCHISCCFSNLPYISFCFLVFPSTSIDSTPLSSKRIKTRVVRRGGRLEAWFSGEDEKIKKYLHEASRKAINNQKLIFFNWLREQKLVVLRSLLKEQLLKRFLEILGNMYLIL